MKYRAVGRGAFMERDFAFSRKRRKLDSRIEELESRVNKERGESKKLSSLKEEHRTLCTSFFEENESMVPALVKHYRERYGYLNFMDLHLVGLEALWYSTIKYDGTTGFAFSTYSGKAIINAFKQVRRKSLRIFENERYREYVDGEKLGDALVDDRWRDVGDVVDEKVKREKFREDFENCFDYEIVGNVESRERIRKERTVLLLRHGFTEFGDMTLEEVGREIGLTRERVRQIQNNGLRRFRNYLKGLYGDPVEVFG